MLMGGSVQSCSNRSSDAVVDKPKPAELPARRWIEEISIARAGMSGRRRMGTAAQHHLADHELAIVLADRPDWSAIAGIGRIGAARPLPHEPEGIVDQTLAGCDFPLTISCG